MASPKRKRARPGEPGAPDIRSVQIRPLERRDWPLIERLFGEKGACGGCWCMYWRVPGGGQAWEEAKGEPNRHALKELVEAGKVHAMLALVGDTPVGWCSFGPTPSFPRLMNSRALARSRTDQTWSLVCFYIHPKHRRQGLARKLLAMATERAFALGASEIEGFPVVPKSPERPVPGPFAWTGVPAMYQTNGFERVSRPEGARPIYLKRRSGRTPPN